MADDLVDLFKPFRDQLKRRVLKSGKVRVRIELTPDSGPFLDLSERGILAPIAEAVLAELRRDIAGVTANVSDETVAYRRKAAAGLRGGKAWAWKRYAAPGGRGVSVPGSQGGRGMNDSGRLLGGLVASVTGTKPVRVTINAPANRLDPSTFTAEEWARFELQIRRWVPALLPGQVFTRPSVQDAISGALQDRLAHTLAENARKRQEMRATMLSIVRMVA